MALNSIITYEHDNIYSCDGVCENCKHIHGNDLCCVNFCRKEYFEELKEYCTDKNTDSGFDYIAKDECININKYTGLIQLKDGTYLEILPKLKGFSIDDSRNIFENLILASQNLTKEYKVNQNTQVQTRTNNRILEIFITVFCKDLKEILKKGIKKSYIRKSENLNVYKGKINFSEHIKKNIASKHKFFVDYSEFSLNIPENRILKSACMYLIKQTEIDENKKVLRQMLVELDDVEPCLNLDKDIQDKQINRLNLYYERPLKYAEFFLKKQSFMPKRGTSKLPALLFPLNEMFEDYIKSILRKKDIIFNYQYSKHYMIKEKTSKKPTLFNLKMDFIIFNNNKALIMDAKWKELSCSEDKLNVSQADLYQLFSYSEAIKNLEDSIAEVEIALLYPKTNQFHNTIEWYYFNNTKVSLVPINVQNPNDNSYLLDLCSKL